MSRTIFVNPLPLASNLYRRHRPYPYPFGGANVTFWYSGRYAIWQGARMLGLEAGDRVLAPAYCCGSEVDPLLRMGLEVDYYRVRPDLSVDLDHIESLCARPARALLVTHYFGFPQDMDEILPFAKNRRMLVIEDNAHGLYSRDARGRPLGSFGDIGVFSFAKTLPVPDGGALVVRHRHRRGKTSVSATRPDLLAVAGKVRHLFQQAAGRASPGLERLLRDRLMDPLVRAMKSRSERYAAADEAGERSEAKLIAFDPTRAGWGMSLASRAIMRFAADPMIPEIRGKNYRELMDRLPKDERVRPLLPVLPDGCCPMALPVLVDNPRELFGFLAARNIRTRYFWSFLHPHVPLDRFPFERSLKRQVLVLPVHQDVDTSDIGRVCEAVVDWLARERGDAVVSRRDLRSPSLPNLSL